MKLSILVSARKNSKYLSKFLYGLYRTTDIKKVEVLVMMNSEDTWNKELVYFWELQGIKFYFENWGFGRAGLHIYFNKLYEYCTGEWILYFCEDHFINMIGWDDYIYKQIENLDYKKPYCLIPRFDNVGTMNHILSRGFIDAMGGELGKNGWIDTYINEVLAKIRSVSKDYVILLQEKTFHDFTHDIPSPMSDELLKAKSVPYIGESLPKIDSAEIKKCIENDANSIINKITNATI